jgi:hypothetical protein
MRSLTIACIATLATGCSLFPSFDGFTGADGGTHDGATTAGDAATAAPCPAGALLCDDFEGASPWTKTMVAPPSTIAVYASGEAPVAPFRGAKALHVTGNASATATYAYLEKTLPSPRTAGTIAMRAYIQLPRAVGDNTHVFSLVDRTGGSLDAFLALRVTRGTWSTETNDTAESSLGHTSTTAPPLGRWACVELDATLGASNGHLVAFVDGAPVLDVADTTVGDAARDTYDTVEVGLVHTDATSTDDLYFDDVVVIVSDDVAPSATPRIGCL